MTYVRKLFLLIAMCSLPLQALWYDVCIDPGHCGIADGGAPGANGDEEPNESDFNLYIALVCQMDLWNLGWSVILTRHSEDGPYMSPEMKAEVANGYRKNDLNERTDFPVSRAVSIHCNGSTDSTKHGTETFWRRNYDYMFAEAVHYGAFNYLQMFPWAYDRGVTPAMMRFLKPCLMPACLIEVAFTTHNVASNAQWYQLRDNQGGFKDYASYGIDDGVTGLWLLRTSPTLLRPSGWELQRGTQILWHPTTVPSVTYSIYRREHPNPDFIMIDSDITDTIYTDNSTDDGTTYSYYVQAVTGSQVSAPSNVLTIHTPPFYSDYSLATAYNNGKKVIYDDNGFVNLVYSSDTSTWFTRSTDYGSSWFVSHCLQIGDFPSIALDGSDNPHFVDIGVAALPDAALSDDTSYVIFYSQHLTDSVWKNPSIYGTYDSILSVSFAIDPLDTGWVVFNTYDDAGNNNLKVGQFYTQSVPESLDNVSTLDTYTGIGIAAIGVKASDRSLHVVYEKNGIVTYRKRDNLGIWSSPYSIGDGHNPSLSVAGALIHFIWETWDISTNILSCYTDGTTWSDIDTVAENISGQGCFPYLEKDSTAIWSQIYSRRWEVFSSERTQNGSWSTPKRISYSLTNSKYPQVAAYQTPTISCRLYLWTDGNQSPYQVKTKAICKSILPPMYAFNLGLEDPSVFTQSRDGYIVYGQGFEKRVDYGTDFVNYNITGLDHDKIYHLGMVFYQDEDNSVWQQGIDIDNSLIETVNLPRKRIIFKLITLSADIYQDGIIDLKIRKVVGPKAVLAAMAVWEFSPDNYPSSHIEDYDDNLPLKFTAFAIPNPTKGSAIIHYQLPKTSSITLAIYSISGQLIREIKDEKAGGSYTFIWDGKDSRGSDVANGVYFYRVESADELKTGKIIFLR